MTPSTPSTPSATVTPGTTLVRAPFPINGVDSEQMAATAAAVALWQQQHAQHMQSVQNQMHLSTPSSSAGLVPVNHSHTPSPPHLPPPPGLTPMTAAGMYNPPTSASSIGYSQNPAAMPMGASPAFNPYMHHVHMMNTMATQAPQPQCQWPPSLNPNEMGAAGMAYITQTTAQQCYPSADLLNGSGIQPVSQQQQMQYYQQQMAQLPPDPAVVQATANSASGPISGVGPLAFTGNPIYSANSTATDYASVTDPLSAFFTLQQQHP